jgi:hypothetical protein
VIFIVVFFIQWKQVKIKLPFSDAPRNNNNMCIQVDEGKKNLKFEHVNKNQRNLRWLYKIQAKRTIHFPTSYVLSPEKVQIECLLIQTTQHKH